MSADDYEPCGIGMCAANEGHSGTCAEASGWDEPEVKPTAEDDSQLAADIVAALVESGGVLLPAFRVLLKKQAARYPVDVSVLAEAQRSRDLIYESRQTERRIAKDARRARDHTLESIQQLIADLDTGRANGTIYTYGQIQRRLELMIVPESLTGALHPPLSTTAAESDTATPPERENAAQRQGEPHDEW